MARQKGKDGNVAARDALLERAVEHVSRHGLADASLRSIAGALGTSHRMLIYHFGSAEAFWTAVIGGLRFRERDALRASAAGGRMPPLRATWASLSAPKSLPRMQLLFETYGRALADRARYKGFLSEVVDVWLDTVGDALATQSRVTKAHARLQARLRLAVLRGLSLDLLTTGDRAGTTAALKWFEARVRLKPRRSPKRSVKRKRT
jgi:AcrR family transcriptional regulator